MGSILSICKVKEHDHHSNFKKKPNFYKLKNTFKHSYTDENLLKSNYNIDKQFQSKSKSNHFILRKNHNKYHKRNSRSNQSIEFIDKACNDCGNLDKKESILRAKSCTQIYLNCPSKLTLEFYSNFFQMF